MPFLLFGSGLDTSQMEFEPLGGGFGQRTRWYDVRAATVVDARRHLSDLFDAAERHGLFIILSSWEFQQSAAFARTPDWHRSLMAVPPALRFEALARAWSALVEEFLGERRRLAGRIYRASQRADRRAPERCPGCRDGPGHGTSALRGGSLAGLRQRCPELLFAAGYERVPTEA